MREGAEPPSPISSQFACFLLLAPSLVAIPMAPIRRFSAEEKGKAPRDEPGLLPPKKRSVHRRDTAVMQVVTRPWCERPPPGYPLPLYAQAEDSGRRSDEQHCRGLGATYANGWLIMVGASRTSPVAPLVASSSWALGLGVQGQRIPWRRPLAPRPRHHLHRCFVAAVNQPLLRRKQPRIIAGSLSFLFSGEHSDGRHCC